MNRFKLILALWVALLGFCAFISTNVYVNDFLLFFGLCGVVYAFARVDENKNKKESIFINKWESFFN